MSSDSELLQREIFQHMRTFSEQNSEAKERRSSNALNASNDNYGVVPYAEVSYRVM